MELKYCEKCNDCSCLISSIFEIATEIVEKNEETIISVRTFIEQKTITNISVLVDVISLSINSLSNVEKIIDKISATDLLASDFSNISTILQNSSLCIENNITEINNIADNLQNKINNILSNEIPDISCLDTLEYSLDTLSNNLLLYKVLQTYYNIIDYEKLDEISIEISCLENYTHSLLGIKVQQKLSDDLWEETIPGNTGINYSILDYSKKPSEKYVSDNISVFVKVKYNGNNEEKPQSRLVIYTIAKNAN